MQAQLQALLVAQEEEQGAVQGVGTEVAKPQVFNGTLEKVLSFVQKRREKVIERKESGNSSSKYRSTRAIIASASSLVPKTGGSSTVGADKTCTNKGSKEDECGHDLHHNATHMLWRQIKGIGIVTTIEDLGIQQKTVETEELEAELEKIENRNMGKIGIMDSKEWLKKGMAII